MNYMKKMIIVGGGAAGMMCAVKAADRYDVTIIEKNEKLGKKLFITGKGRCNLTNNTDEETFLRNVVSNYKFLYSSIYSYNQSMVMDDFEKWGLRLKTERGNRVFPLSDHSSDVLKTLEEQLKRKKVKILLNTPVTGLDFEEAETKKVTGVFIGKKKLDAEVVVLATGGLSYPQTGSTGDGFEFLKEVGMDESVTEIFPALCPLVIRQSFCHEMMGLSLRNVKAKVEYIPNEITKKNKVKKLYEEQGEMLFTHFGVSGPLMLSASSYIASFVRKTADAPEELTKERINNVNAFFKTLEGKVIVTVDLKPALSFEELDARVQKDFDKFSNREFSNSLGELLPRLMIPVVVHESGIKPDKKVNLITHDERKRLVEVLKGFKMEVAGFKGFSEAIISSGGINVKYIDAGTMEIKGVDGLRAAGEIIDVDALTGGFNLQIAWSTANLAAQ